VGDDHDRKQRLSQLEVSSERYVAFCGLICFVAFFILGWPMLIAWVGLAWGMQQYCHAMKGTVPKQQSQKTRKTRKPKRRCCD